MRDHVVGEPIRCTRVNRGGCEIASVIAYPRARTPSPRERDRLRPRVVCPSVEADRVITDGRVDFDGYSVKEIGTIKTVIRTTVIEISAPRKVAAVETIRTLHEARSPALSKDTGMVRTLHHHTSGSVKAVVNVETALGIVNVTDPPVRSALKGVAVPKIDRLRPMGRRPARDPGVYCPPAA